VQPTSGGTGRRVAFALRLPEVFGSCAVMFLYRVDLLSQPCSMVYSDQFINDNVA